MPVYDLVNVLTLHQGVQQQLPVLSEDVREPGCEPDVTHLQDLVYPVLEGRLQSPRHSRGLHELPDESPCEHPTEMQNDESPKKAEPKGYLEYNLTTP